MLAVVWVVVLFTTVVVVVVTCLTQVRGGLLVVTFMLLLELELELDVPVIDVAELAELELFLFSVFCQEYVVFEVLEAAAEPVLVLLLLEDA